MDPDPLADPADPFDRPPEDPLGRAYEHLRLANGQLRLAEHAALAVRDTGRAAAVRRIRDLVIVARAGVTGLRRIDAGPEP